MEYPVCKDCKEEFVKLLYVKKSLRNIGTCSNTYVYDIAGTNHVDLNAEQQTDSHYSMEVVFLKRIYGSVWESPFV